MENKKLLSEIHRMQELAGIISENKEMLNEDILELKQMSKQLYTFLKSKGMQVALMNKMNLTKPNKDIGEQTAQSAQVVVNEEKQIVHVAVSPWTIAYVLSGGGDGWIHKAYAKFGQDTALWWKNPDITKYINNLGNELSQQLKAKYPNMLYQFRTQDNFWYIMDYGYGQTKKGGQLDPNKVKKPAPQQQPPAQAAE